MNVLLVDDDALGAESMVALLALLGHHAEFAVNAEAALARMHVRPFDALVFDARMPGTDGLALAGKVRELPGWERTPIILLTALAGGQLDEACDRLAALQPAAVVGKPCFADDLLAAIERLLPEGGRK